MGIYVKEMPKSCRECPCSFQDVATFKWCNAYEKGKLTFISDDTYKEKRFEDCPLKLIHDHDKELVAKVLGKIKILAKDNFDFDMCNECGEFVHNDNVLTESDFNKILDQIQKEFEK